MLYEIAPEDNGFDRPQTGKKLKYLSDPRRNMEETAPEPYSITFEQRPEYLYAYVEGERDSYAISISYWKKVARECGERGTTRVLIDENIVENVSIADMYQVASEIPEMFSGIAIAFCDRYADQSEINEFGELVAQNRGVVGRIFADIEAAESWLLTQQR
jgi:hypothetical protein